jgi:hypothetical protein
MAAAVAVLPPSQVMIPYALQTFVQLQDHYGEGCVSDFESFLQEYGPAIANQLGLATTQNITLNVRLNPLSSVHTRLLVNVQAEGWYETLCETLGARALVDHMSGKSLSEFPLAKLAQLNSICAQYQEPLNLPVEQRFSPLEAPIQYSPLRSDIAKNWFNDVLVHMAYALGDKLYEAVPAVVDQNFSSPDDIAWQSMTNFMNNKKALQAFLTSTLNSISPILPETEISSVAQQDIMNHVYKSLVKAVNAHQEELRYVFLKDGLHLIDQRIEMLQSSLSPTEAAKVASAQPITNVSLFEEGDVITSSLSASAMSISSLSSMRKSIWEKMKTAKAKRDAKAAGRKADKAKDATKYAQDKADREAQRAQEKREKAEVTLAKQKEKQAAAKQRRKEAKQAKKSSTAVSIEEHPIGTLIGNFILQEAATINDLAVIAEIANDCCCLPTRKTTKTHSRKTEIVHEETFPTQPPKPKEKEKEKEKPKVVEKEKTAVTAVATVSSSTLPLARPLVAKQPSPSPLVVKRNVESKPIPGVPTMKAVDTLLGSSLKIASPSGDGYKTLTKAELMSQFGQTHRYASNYVATLPAEHLKLDHIYLHNDNAFGSNASIASVKQSLARAPITLDTTTLARSFVIQEFGQGHVFHIVK